MDVGPVSIRPSGRKHGISDERIRYAIKTCPRVLEHPTIDGQVIFLGPDQNGVPLEVVGWEYDSGEVEIVHAMRLRPSYKDAYEEVMRWL